MDLYVLLATYCPNALISVPTQMVTADLGYTYTFGTDADGNNLYPVGSVSIFRSLGDIPSWAMVEGVEFEMEGNLIRFPDNRPFSGPAPYFHGTLLPLTLTAATAPTLKPIQARSMIISCGAIRYAEDLGNAKQLANFQTRFQSEWTRWIAVLQTQYARIGAIAATNPNAAPGRSKWYGSHLRGLFR